MFLAATDSMHVTPSPPLHKACIPVNTMHLVAATGMALLSPPVNGVWLTCFFVIIYKKNQVCPEVCKMLLATVFVG